MAGTLKPFGTKTARLIVKERAALISGLIASLESLKKEEKAAAPHRFSRTMAFHSVGKSNKS
jgi:hypothetical protein